MSNRFNDLKILLVDDNQLFVDLLTALFSGWAGIEIRSANNGAAALALWAEEPVDLVICDWHMAPMDGGQFMQALRARPERAAELVPIVVISGDSNPARAAEALAFGASAYLVKPLERVALFQLVADLVTGQRPV